jgi:hypothetical protein
MPHAPVGAKKGIKIFHEWFTGWMGLCCSCDDISQMSMSLSFFGIHIGVIENLRFSEVKSKMKISSALLPGRKELHENSFDK